MSQVNIQLANDTKVLTISVQGKFDFWLINDFREAYSNIDEPFDVLKIDMRNVSTIDSSGLGMLLTMQKFLNKEDGEIKIINCNASVAKVFNITNFNKKFGIS